jgi:hypothetical protein
MLPKADRGNEISLQTLKFVDNQTLLCNNEHAGNVTGIDTGNVTETAQIKVISF